MAVEASTLGELKKRIAEAEANGANDNTRVVYRINRKLAPMLADDLRLRTINPAWRQTDTHSALQNVTDGEQYLCFDT